MKVAVIKSAPKDFDFGVSGALDVICEIMNELGIEVYTADLFDDQIHHYKGVLSDAVQQIADNVKSSDGVIFSTVSCLFAPSSALSALFEYLHHDYNDVLTGKNCMSLVVNSGVLNGSDRSASDYLGKVLSHFGAFDSIRVCFDDKTAKLAAVKDTEEHGILEKQTEDFYRIVAQNRKFFASYAYDPKLSDSVKPVKDFKLAEIEPEELDLLTGLDDKEIEILESISPKKSDGDFPAFKLESFNEEQEEDIEVLTNFFSQILENPEEEEVLPDFTLPPIKKIVPTMASRKNSSCLAETKSLSNRFNPKEASGINSVMQLNISGDGGFDGHFHINNSECSFAQGIFANPDITILSDSAVWLNILNGNITAQRAFMVGQLKVRGNFTLLNKFENMFRT
ncbi:MAG: SCP2 sterol-binding domain-containing protein [Defluviitaleaceae bacterium]|nr:SCP2 sterol-binding domain-containing protein [Defluviitaleaceae bacterium]